MPPLYYEERDQERVPPWLTGLIERFVFTFIVMFYPAGAATGVVGWLGLKMAASWNKDVLPRTAKDGHPHERLAARMEQLTWNRHAFLGLLTGFISLCFAWVGGAVAKLVIWGLDPQ